MQRTAALAAWLAVACVCAAAAQPTNTMPGMAPAAPASPTAPTAPAPAGKKLLGTAFVPLNAATPGYKQAMDKMMAGTDAPYSGDADHDFVTHMVPHHQGAIDMAEIELKYGADAKLKQLAARIISAQQREIAFMQAWLEKHPKPKQMGADIPPNIQWK
jgi:uncharacterized protein (DUF305 family)